MHVHLDELIRDVGYTEAINMLMLAAEMSGAHIKGVTQFNLRTWHAGRVYDVAINPNAEHHREFFETALAKRKLKKLHDRPSGIQWPKPKITWDKDDFGSLIVGDNP